jgi:zinc transport system ATP-binding protein
MKLNDIGQRADRPACGLCSTEVRNLGVRRGGRAVLEGVDLRFRCGEATVLIGRNGAGKTTLLKAMLGEIRSEGEILFHAECGGRLRKPVFGYVPQSLQLDPGSPVTVSDLFAASLLRRPVWLPGARRGEAATGAALARSGAAHLAGKPLGRLSGGELQRVLLAYALEPVPDILLLDEPVSGIDHAGMREFYALLSALRKEHDLAIVMVSHDFDLAASLADRVVFLDGRVVCSGTPGEVFAHPAVIEAFGPVRLEEGTRP